MNMFRNLLCLFLIAFGTALLVSNPSDWAFIQRGATAEAPAAAPNRRKPLRLIVWNILVSSTGVDWCTEFEVRSIGSGPTRLW